MTEDNYSDKTDENKRMNINTWFRIVLISGITGVILYKILISPFDFSSFDFSDLLSLILALFSILLAVMFYYKATDTSNLFYDNSYRFTKDISNILGRIEAGFGERLRHLDEGYSGLRDVIYKTPMTEKAAENKIEEKELEVENIEKEKQKIIDKLVEDAKLKDMEAGEVKDQLIQKDKELEQARNVIRQIENELGVLRNNKVFYNSPSSIRERSMNEFEKYFVKRVFPLLGSSALEDPKQFHHRFVRVKNQITPGWIKDAIMQGYIDKNYNLTSHGINYFRDIFEGLDQNG